MIKITVNLNDEVYKALKRLAAIRGMEMTEIINLAISNEQFLEDAQLRGDKVLLRSLSGTYEQILFKR